MLGSCVVDGKAASAMYPLLPGSPRFCSDCHTPSVAGRLFGVDFSPPDDFDVPSDDFEIAFRPPYDKNRNAWTNKEGNTCKLFKLADSHLLNIYKWINRNAKQAIRSVGVRAASQAVAKEIEKRGLPFPTT